MKEKKIIERRDWVEHQTLKIATKFKPIIKAKTELKLRRMPSWKKGFKAGKQGKSLENCPYKLDEEMWKLLRKRARWLRGYEVGWSEYSPNGTGKKKRQKSD